MTFVQHIRFVTGMPRLAVVAVVLVAIVAMLGCETDQRKIESQNQAARQGELSDASTGMVSVFDLRDGDCFDADIPGFETIDFEQVQRVECTGDWQFRVVQSIFLSHPNDASYPGESYMDDVVAAQCTEATTTFLFPTEDSWKLGDRVITCLEESA